MIFEFKLPDIGEGVVEGEIVQWKVKTGDYVKEDEPLVEIMTDKATVEIPSPKEGKVVEVIGKEGEKVKVGSVLVRIETISEEVPMKEKSKEGEKEIKRVLATPAIRKLARELNIDLNEIQGSGEDGRILHEDLLRFKEKISPTAKSVEYETLSKEKTKEAEPFEEYIPLIGIRKKIAEKMSLSKNKIPDYGYVDEVDMTEIIELRDKILPIAEEKKIKFTFLPIIIKALIKALKKYPIINSVLDEENGRIIIKKYYNIGIATATEKGLIVPVIKNADKKSMLELAKEIEELADLARTGRIKLEDLQGGTFSITNIGSIGGLFAFPIINYPETAIMGINKIKKRAVVRDDKIEIRDMMYISFSFDHRVIDGAIGAEFAQYLIRNLENPDLFIMEMV